VSTTTAVRRARSISWAHPTWLLAIKAALAAMLAWLAVQPLGGAADDYAYYAPLGALVAMTTTVVSSMRSSLQAVAAIAIGAALALAVAQVDVPEPIGLGVVILVAVLIGAYAPLGTMGSWVPLAAMFVLIAGAGDPMEYAAAYGGLTAFGAVVGVVVNLLLPQLRLTPAAIAQDRLRDELADQLDQLGTALEQEIVGEKDWTTLRSALQRQARDAEALIAEAREARRVNWHASRWATTVDRHDLRARALQRLTGCVDDVISLVSDQRAEIRNDDPAAAELRATAAIALATVADLLRDEGSPDEARQAVADLRARVVRAQADTGDHHFAAAAITLDLEQAVDAWT
jgi:uncharacterized membrane protein YgaE (UPF0421/DUF939 family)